MLKGVDISKWNGSINFSKLKGQVDFVIMRAGYGKLTSQKMNALKNIMLLVKGMVFQKVATGHLMLHLVLKLSKKLRLFFLV